MAARRIFLSANIDEPERKQDFVMQQGTDLEIWFTVLDYADVAVNCSPATSIIWSLAKSPSTTPSLSISGANITVVAPNSLKVAVAAAGTTALTGNFYAELCMILASKKTILAKGTVKIEAANNA